MNSPRQPVEPAFRCNHRLRIALQSIEMRSAPRIGAVLAITVVGLVAAACSASTSATISSSPLATQTTLPTSGAVAYDAARKAVVLVTPGPTRAASVMETWTWDGHLWSRQRPAHSPTMRSDPLLAYDESRRVTILYGGLGRTGNLDDTWAWDGSNWTLLQPAHTPTTAQQPGSMAYDPASHRVLLYQFWQQTWSWDGTDWTELQPAHAPDAWDGKLAFDGEHLILVGGSSVINRMETWAWTGSDWNLLLSAHTPELAPIEPMTFDSGSGKVVLYGGGPGDDTWTWNGSSWMREHPPHSPASSWPPQLVDDRALHTVVAFAASEYQAPISGIYAWNGTDWSAVGAGSPPAAAAGKGLMPVADAAAAIRRRVTNTTPALLLPSFPAGVDEAQVTADDVTFSLQAWNDDRSIDITLGIVVPGNSNLGAANKTIIFRGGSAYYQYIANDPSGWRSIWWTERPGSSRSDFGLKDPGGVPYALSAAGLTETEFFALGNSLR